MILAKVSIEVNVIELDLLWEVVESCLQSHLAICLTRVFLHTFDCLIQLILEDFDSLDRVFQYECSKLRIELSQLIHVNVESILPSNCVSHSLSYLILVQVLLYSFLESESFLIIAD